MLSVRSEFGWNDVDKCVNASEDVFNDWVRTHPNAKRLRGKSFPHFDELGSIFGKDRAIGAGAETTSDMVRAIDGEDNVEREQFVDAINTNFDCIEEVSTCATSRRPGSLKRANSVEQGNDLLKHLSNFQSTYQHGVNEFIAYLRKEFELNDRMKKLSTVLQALEGFTRTELMKVRAHIRKEEWKVKYLFALSEESRIEFVKFQLEEIALSD
ncbi:hypothetical protein PTKIN_Ptkin06aG0045000 [Pterospermum kingtungense]